jgi:hypothetical protein
MWLLTSRLRCSLDDRPNGRRRRQRVPAFYDFEIGNFNSRHRCQLTPHIRSHLLGVPCVILTERFRTSSGSEALFAAEVRVD